MNEPSTTTARLPKTVLPRRYDLEIAPDLETFAYSGRVEIALDVAEPTDTIVLHAAGLEVAIERLAQGDAAIDGVLAVDAEHEQLRITTAQPLTTGPATLVLAFTGTISSGLLGFYRSTFVDGTGTSRVLAATQFEAPHARKAFPCFDEPEFKAVFATTLVVDDGLLALSNGPEIGREPAGDGKVRVRFGDTISMSTYLVAWVVGPLEITDPVDAGGVAVRVAYAPGRGHLTQFALDVGAFAIKFFVDYYGIPYPGAKCDLIALPDFSFGAMENLGCVTFRETRLLLDPKEVTLDEMAGAAQTITHEIAHMWFGDLVTMKWWNGIWLNEAFATFMENLGVAAYKPEWKTWDDFAVGRAAALDVDALPSTRTVEYEVITPEDADGMFDTLTYQKGGSVLRMLERWLGADAFRAGVRHYLEQYKYGNTETTDLWDALEAATGKPVRSIMDTWIFQPGYPALETDGATLTQRRFSYTGENSTTWVVPVLARVHTGSSSETRSLLLSDPSAPIADVPNDALLVLNAGGEGFYRVAYPPAWRDRLLESGVLLPLERSALVDDVWAALLAGRASAEEFLAVALRFADETELVVWRILAARLRATGRLVTGPALERLQARVADAVRPTVQRLGWDAISGGERTSQLRGLAVSLLGGFAGDPETVARAREIEERGGADASLESACVDVVAGSGTADDFERYIERSAASTNPQQQLRYLYALADFPAEELVLRAEAYAYTDAVRPQNAPFVLQRALRNRDHGPAAWAFLRDHWDETMTRFSPSLAPRILEGATWLVEGTTPDDVTSFVAAHPLATGQRTVQQHMDRIRINRAAVDRERDRFSESLLRD